MITKKNIKELDFDNISDYFYYILESITNGQNNQAKELFTKLSATQKLDFYLFCNVTKNPLVPILDIVNN
jgi:hypothetical protein